MNIPWISILLLVVGVLGRAKVRTSRGEGRRLRFQISGDRDVDLNRTLEAELALMECIYAEMSQEHARLSRKHRRHQKR